MMETTTSQSRPLNVQTHCNADAKPTLGSDTQKQCLELLLERNRTAWELIHRLRVTNGADIIYKLRGHGWKISTIPQEDDTKHTIYQLDTDPATAKAVLKAYKGAK